MNKDEIKSDINNQISKINKSFNPYVSIYNYKEIIYGIDINSLEKLLKKVVRFLIIYTILTFISSVILIIVSFGSIYAKIYAVDVNKLRFTLFFECSFALASIKYYNLKKNLENKIYLLKLINKVDKT